MWTINRSNSCPILESTNNSFHTTGLSCLEFVRDTPDNLLQFHAVKRCKLVNLHERLYCSHSINDSNTHAWNANVTKYLQPDRYIPAEMGDSYSYMLSAYKRYHRGKSIHQRLKDYEHSKAFKWKEVISTPLVFRKVVKKIPQNNTQQMITYKKKLSRIIQSPANDETSRDNQLFLSMSLQDGYVQRCHGTKSTLVAYVEDLTTGFGADPYASILPNTDSNTHQPLSYPVIQESESYATEQKLFSPSPEYLDEQIIFKPIVNQLKILQPVCNIHNQQSSRTHAKIKCSTSKITTKRPIERSKTHEVLSFKDLATKAKLVWSTYQSETQKNTEMTRFSTLFLQNSASDEDLKNTDKKEPPTTDSETSRMFICSKGCELNLQKHLQESSINSLKLNTESKSGDSAATGKQLSEEQTSYSQSANQYALFVDPSHMESADTRPSMISYCGIDINEEERQSLFDVPMEYAAAEIQYRRAQLSGNHASIFTSRSSVFSALQSLIPEVSNKRSSIVFKKNNVISADEGCIETKNNQSCGQNTIGAELDFTKDGPTAPVGRVHRSSLNLVHPPRRGSMLKPSENQMIEELLPYKDPNEITPRWTGTSWATIDSTEISRGLHLMGVENSDSSNLVDALSGDIEPSISGDLNKPCLNRSVLCQGTTVNPLECAALISSETGRVRCLSEPFPITPALHCCSMGLYDVHPSTVRTTPNFSKFLFLMKQHLLRRARAKNGRFGHLRSY